MNTKTPWEAKINAVGTRHGVGPVNGRFVATMVDGSLQSIENAAFIVRACNAHDDLVEAIEHAQAYIMANRGSVSTKPTEIAEKIRAALAKAKA